MPTESGQRDQRIQRIQLHIQHSQTGHSMHVSASGCDSLSQCQREDFISGGNFESLLVLLFHTATENRNY